MRTWPTLWRMSLTATTENSRLSLLWSVSSWTHSWVWTLLQSIYTGLTNIVEKIEQLTLHCFAGFQFKENKKLFLRGAFITYEWALAPLQSMKSNRYDFKAFVAALNESIHISEELTMQTAPFSPHFRSMMTRDTYESFFHRYSCHPRDFRKHGTGHRR